MRDTLIDIMQNGEFFGLNRLYNQYKLLITTWNGFVMELVEYYDDTFLEGLIHPVGFDVENYTNGMEIMWILVATKAIKKANISKEDKDICLQLLGYNRMEIEIMLNEC